MLIVSVLLLISFDIFFPGLKYKDNWKKANLIVTIKDITLTIDRLNDLYELSFSKQKLDNFLSKIFTQKNVVWWSGTEGAVKPVMRIACNCTDEEIGNLTDWFNSLVVNGRNITVYFVKSGLSQINEPSDALLIFGYKDLTPYVGSIDSYLRKGKGIVYISDLKTVDDETKKVFGIDLCSKISGISCGWGVEPNITFIKPSNASTPNYKPWKLFFHFPETIKTKYEQDSVPLDPGTEQCSASPVYNGTLKLRADVFNFWTCNETNKYKLYLDTNNNNKADKVVEVGKSFTLDGFNFNFSYAIDNKTIAIAYRPTYNFTDFLGRGKTQVYPTDKNIYRIVVHKGNYSNGNNPTQAPIPAAVVNNTNGRTAWITNFARDGLLQVGDDEKELLLSLLLYVTDKNYKLPNLFKIGYQLPYINVRNRDMYEVYKFYLGLGHPY